MRKPIVYIMILISASFLFGDSPDDNGFVELRTEKQEAEMRKQDNELAQRIHEKLSEDWFTEGYKYFNIKVHYGVVTVKGLVETERDRQNVEEEIRNIIGVKKLNSRIQVLRSNNNSRLDRSEIESE